MVIGCPFAHSNCGHFANMAAILRRCYGCMSGNNLSAAPSETALKLMGHAESPLDQPYSRPGQVPGCALRYKHITFFVRQAKPGSEVFGNHFVMSHLCHRPPVKRYKKS